MERTITQYFGPEEYERVAMLYSQDVDATTLAKFEELAHQRLTLTATFGAEMPADAHNRGLYLYCNSPLGSTAIYTERFGGRHDLAAMLHEQEKSFNLLWDILLLQLDTLVEDSVDYETLRSFLDTTMRADLWDLTLELTVTDLGEDAMNNLAEYEELPDDAMPAFMRAVHFFDARGYIEPQEVFAAMVAADDDDDDWRFAMKTLGQAIGHRMGMKNGAMPPAFEALMDYSDDELEEEIERFFDSDERVTAMLADFRAGFDGMSADLFDIGGDARDITLYVPVEPYETNGTWVEASEPVPSGNEDVIGYDPRSYVEWQYPLAGIAPDGDLAQVVYAFWAEPAEAYQVERFGAPVLDDDLLAEQCRWRQMLGSSLQDEWDAFIDGLSPGPDLADTLRQFRFSIEGPVDPDNTEVTQSRMAKDVIGRLVSKLPSDKSRN